MKPERVDALNVEGNWKVQSGYRSTPRLAPLFLGLKSPRAFCTLPLRFSRPSCSLQLTLSHHLSHQTKYISQPAVWLRNSFRCIFTVSDWERGRKTKKIWISKSSQPTGWWTDWWQRNLAWLWSINVSPIIKLGRQIKLCCMLSSQYKHFCSQEESTAG